MRLALALCALVAAAVPGKGQDDPPLPVRQGIDAAVAAAYVNQKCPLYRVSIYEFKIFMDARSLKPSDLNSKYKDYYEKIHEKAQGHGELSQEQFCDILGDFYGEHGTFPGIIVRR